MSQPALQLGYCTNVHAGADLAQTWENLRTHAVAAKRKFSPSQPMGVGLWLSAATAGRLTEQGQIEAFADWLAAEGLVPFTLNGFPYGDFHQDVVKHRVYQPTWFEQARYRYTLDLIEILDAILPPGLEGSISTLPIAWGRPRPEPKALAAAAAQLAAIAERLRALERESGRLIYLCIEPEPGCVIERSQDVVSFFEDYLDPAGEPPTIRRYLRVCHDICHAAVMFEAQRDAVERYARADISIGKVQVSSAVRLPLEALAADARTAALAELTRFAEDRYLHQTVIRGAEAETFYEDLPAALARISAGDAELRVHFHVPIYLEAFGHLRSSRADILECLAALRRHSSVSHFEIETYAWGVLPAELRQPELAAGIAAELEWFTAQQSEH